MSLKKPTELKFAEIVEVVEKHHDPKPSVIVQHYQFNSRSRRAGESVADYVAELRHLSEHCEFGKTLNKMLRDRLVCGVEEAKIQRQLLAEPDLTFDKAFKLAIAVESAEENAKDLWQPISTATINRMQHKKNCHCHSATDCKFKTAECHKCGKKGHIAHACRSKPPTQEPRPLCKFTQHTTHIVTEDLEDYTMYT